MIYNLNSHEVTVLEDVASVIWSHIPDRNPINVSTIVSKLLPIYNIDKETLIEDVTEFCNSLFSEGLLFLDDEVKRMSNFKSTRSDHSLASLPENNDVERLITNRLAKKNQIFATMIEVTQKCNEQCIHCYATKDSNKLCTGELSKEEICSIIDQLADLGCLYLIFTGGEAFYRRDFLEIVKYARFKRFVVDIYTNGLLVNSSNIESICEQMPRAVYLSIYSMNPVVHDSITGIKGSHRKTIQAILLLRENQVPVAINVTVLSENSSDYRGITEFAKSVGATCRISYDISPRFDGNNEPLKYRINNKETIFELLRFNSYTQTQSASARFNPEKAVCAAGAASLAISATGNVFPCITLRKSMGNVRVQEISDLWKYSKIRKDIANIKWRDLPTCVDCPHRDYCTPCMGISDLEHGDMYAGNQGDCFNSQCKHEFSTALVKS
ncbi:MAG: PqqD family peptide modification chaperone [Candidatus Electrothrix sp. Rat3]|nr:PqqD family peptide modification chaperone [Candidatus Electrothrix rattekaaiensis]